MNMQTNQRSDLFSRRRFVGHTLLVSAALALGKSHSTAAPSADLLHETFNALLAFILPGSDAYSVAQGVSTVDRGGVDAGVIEVFIATLDDTTPFVPNFSAQVAAILNGLAQAVDATPGGSFLSPFANLTFAEKAVVFQAMDANPQFAPLAGVLTPFVAFLCYSESGTFDPQTRTLTGPPLGWQLCQYQGVSDGRAEFRGYFQNRSACGKNR